MKSWSGEVSKVKPKLGMFTPDGDVHAGVHAGVLRPPRRYMGAGTVHGNGPKDPGRSRPVRKPLVFCQVPNLTSTRRDDVHSLV